MATTVATLIQQTRRLLRDFPDFDVLTASLAQGGATISVGDGTIYNKNEYLEIDQEVLRATANGGASSVAVSGARKGSVAASHANGATVLMNPRFFSVEIFDELNNALDACYPRIYREVVDESVIALTDTYEYTLPSVNGVPIPYIEDVWVHEPGGLATRFVPRREWSVVRGVTPKLKFRSLPTPSATIRILGLGPFAHFAATTDVLDAQFPQQAQSLLPLYAAAALLDSGEALRVRQETGALDSREQATSVTSSSRQASKLQQRFYTQVERWAMSPPRKAIRVK